MTDHRIEVIACVINSALYAHATFHDWNPKSPPNEDVCKILRYFATECEKAGALGFTKWLRESKMIRASRLDGHDVDIADFPELYDEWRKSC